jgi:hypothetical protein
VGLVDNELRDMILATCKQSITKIDDPFFRRDMAKIVHSVERGDWVFLVLKQQGPLPGDQYSGARLGPDDRPMILIYTPVFDRDYAQALESHSRRELRVSMQTLFVLSVLHEGSHILGGDLNDKKMSLSEHLDRESEVWRYVIEHGLIPARRQGQLPHLIIPMFADALAAFEHANSDMWQRYMDVITVPGGEDYKSFVAELYGDE